MTDRNTEAPFADRAPENTSAGSFDAPDAARHRRALLALGAAVLIWSIPPILVRYFAGYFDPVTQSTYRYLFLIAGLWGYVALVLRKEFAAYRPDWGLIGAGAACIAVYQLSWVTATYFIMPALMHLLLKLNVVTSPAMTWLWEHTERSIVKSRMFLVGSLLSLLGAAGLILGGEGHAVESVSVLPGWQGYAVGVGLCIVSAFAWPGYSICAKRLAGRGHPMVVYTYVGTAAGCVFLAISVATGQMHQILSAPPVVIALVAISGVVCMGVAHGVYMVALRQLGVAVCVLGLLMAPLLTCAWSWIAFGETLEGLQWPSAVILLAGCSLAIRRRQAVGSRQ